MARPNQNSPEILREEILADARRESEGIIRRAQKETEELLAKATAEANTARLKSLDQACTEAARRTELILATVLVEAGRLRSARVEALLETVHDEVRERLKSCDGLDYREVIIALATEAIRRMHGSAFVVRLSAADRAALSDRLFAEDVAHRVGRPPITITISNDAALTEGGPIIEDIEGRQVWDNRVQARLERMWPELRRQIAVRTALVGGSEAAGGVA